MFKLWSVRMIKVSMLRGLMIKDLLRSMLVKKSTFDDMSNRHQELAELTRVVTGSRSEYFQDLWVLSRTNSKRAGFFVEFGALDGVGASNTWLLEKEFGWTGILAEPSRSSFEELRLNRSCLSDSRAVWDRSGEQLLFSEREENYLSSVKTNVEGSAISNEYFVESVTLNDLLVEHKAPAEIDYISVDVEGSELRILNEFFKSRIFDVKYFTIEHNWREDKRALISLMKVNGYTSVFESLSYRDLFFVKKDL